MALHPSMFEDIVRRALDEDLGEAGDLTSNACIPANAHSRAELVARAPGVVAGVAVGEAVFRAVDGSVQFAAKIADGDAVAPGNVVAVVEGSTRSILMAERTALNLVSRMSGVATATSHLVAAIAGTAAIVTDTRKTMPGLRALDKYAVRVGGGRNHRYGLHDAVMIKDNHIAAAGGIAAAVRAVRARVGHTVKVEVEVETLDELAELLEVGADIVLLDNMDVDTLGAAVEMVGGSMVCEASGGITVETARAVAETGVDVISVGWITHSAAQLDVALDFT